MVSELSTLVRDAGLRRKRRRAVVDMVGVDEEGFVGSPIERSPMNGLSKGRREESSQVKGPVIKQLRKVKTPRKVMVHANQRGGL